MNRLSTPNQAAEVESTLKPASCPGCSAKGVALPGLTAVFGCTGCGGLFTTVGAITHAQACTFVGLDRPMAPASAHPFYFDFDVVESGRVHGWADRTTGTVVQYG